MSRNYSIICFGFQIDQADKEAFELDDEEIYDLIEEDSGLELIYHGSEDEKNYVIAIKRSVIRCHEYSSPIQFPLKKLEVSSDWQDKLKKFAVKNNLNIGKIGWWLCHESL